jgi:sirohydrochlorin cobaltochelatase
MKRPFDEASKASASRPWPDNAPTAPRRESLTRAGVAMTRAVEDGVTDVKYDGVILIAHGARDQRWIEPFVRMRAELATKLGACKVVLSFMEFAPPTLADAALELHRAGVARVLLVPVFLSGGGHVANDIPALVAAERTRYPAITFDVAGAIGEEVEVTAAMMAAVTRLAMVPPGS